MVRPSWKRWLIAAIKAVVAVLVLWAVGRHVLRVWNDLKRHEVVLQRPASVADRLGILVSGWPGMLRAIL